MEGVDIGASCALLLLLPSGIVVRAQHLSIAILIRVCRYHALAAGSVIMKAYFLHFLLSYLTIPPKGPELCLQDLLVSVLHAQP